MSKRRVDNQLGTFIRQYGRKTGHNIDPNDRHYDRKVESRVKRMDPLDLAVAMGQLDEDEADKIKRR